jgi:DNA-binding transcriptional MerR regulator
LLSIRGYRPQKVRKITGLTTRQLDHWDRIGFISPSLRRSCGRGNARCYSFTDLVALKTAKSLLDTGLPLKRIRAALDFLQKNLGQQNISSHSFITDGKNVFELTDDPSYIVDLNKGGQVTWNINIASIATETRKKLLIIDKTLSKRRPCEESERATPRVQRKSESLF